MILHYRVERAAAPLEGHPVCYAICRFLSHLINNAAELGAKTSAMSPLMTPFAMGLPPAYSSFLWWHRAAQWAEQIRRDVEHNNVRDFSADGNYEVSFMCNVLIHHSGEVLWVPPAIYKSSCIIGTFMCDR
ncbi:hypothetical protein ANCDUO_03638 [Ancylostoma duodenale]|uniref:Neurotransmitter-gated ion-channel ligand-binding domain-containing protein n=1 Tax=Ancylostoma duodenale TaxID=51022 RepID=A0A0C2H921_9BILA|nr:hypothetical protein ANCDUO_03638 [Ancylostoma duodenale]